MKYIYQRRVDKPLKTNWSENVRDISSVSSEYCHLELSKGTIEIGSPTMTNRYKAQALLPLLLSRFYHD